MSSLLKISLPTAFKASIPFWADVDTTIHQSYNETGNIWYRQDTTTSLLQRVTQEIRSVYLEHSSFTATWVLVVTWDRVGYFHHHKDKVRE